MARVLGEHFKVNGKPKKSYKNKREAVRAAHLENKRAYECSFCGKWHLASVRTNR